MFSIHLNVRGELSQHPHAPLNRHSERADGVAPWRIENQEIVKNAIGNVILYTPTFSVALLDQYIGSASTSKGQRNHFA